MTKEQPLSIVRELAKQAGFIVDKESLEFQPNCIISPGYLIDVYLLRFYEAAVKKEREACAVACEDIERFGRVLPTPDE